MVVRRLVKRHADGPSGNLPEREQDLRDAVRVLHCSLTSHEILAEEPAINLVLDSFKKIVLLADLLSDSSSGDPMDREVTRERTTLVLCLNVKSVNDPLGHP